MGSVSRILCHNFTRNCILRMTESPYFKELKRNTRSSGLDYVNAKVKEEPTSVATDLSEFAYSNPRNKKDVKHEQKKQKALKRAATKQEKVEIKYENEQTISGNTATEGKKARKEPQFWREQIQNIEEMRKFRDAPVDSMDCDVISDEKASPEVYRYQVLLSLMLSSQTKDQITSAAMARLRRHGCNIPNILQTPDAKLGELIYPVGFWKKKVEFIKKTSKILQEEYHGDIPDSVAALCKLPGVGPKMAYLVMKCAWNQVIGIGVDTHVHRICNRLGWVKTKQPEETRKALEDWLPREHWSSINHLLVGFGQQICAPVAPKCVGCLNNTICPFGKSQMRSKGSKVKKEES